MLRDKDGLTEQEFLRQYRPGDYTRPSVACDMAVFTVTAAAAESYRKDPVKELRLLLIERGGHPFLGCWALPGGFVGPDETVTQAAARELREETGVSDVYLEQLGVFSDPARDPRTWVMSCAHLALIDGGKVRVCAGDDARNAAWFQLSFDQIQPQRDGDPVRYALRLADGGAALSAVVERRHPGADGLAVLENDGLAFDHAKIIVCAMEHLRSAVGNSGIALSLMPPLFTMGELQQVCEAILGRPLLKAAFRRKMAPYVRQTAGFSERAGHRPARLYQRG